MTIHDSFNITGPGAGAFANEYVVKVGGLTAYIESSTSDSLRVGMPASDPGTQPVVIEHKHGTGSPLVIGSITVAKYVLPRIGSEFSPGIIKVRLAPDVDPSQVKIGNDDFRRLVPDGPLAADMAGWFVVNVPAGSEIDRIRAYSDRDQVEVAEYDQALRPGRAPNDNLYPGQENVRTARLTAAWEARTTGYPIAILDTGVAPSHEELAGLITQDQDCMGLACVAANPASMTTACDYHGTQVAAIAVAHTNNQIGTSPGIAGGTWGNQFGSYRVLDGSPCRGSTSSLILGLNKAIDHGFRIINMSLWTSASYVSVQSAVTAAYSAGAFMISIAGNAGTSQRQYPGAYDYVFAIANSMSNGGIETLAPSSSYGDWVDLAAPGTSVITGAGPTGYTVIPGTSNGNANGTSFAAPLVAAVAAMIRQAGTTNQGIAPLLQGNADQVNWGTRSIGGGRLNAYKSLGMRGCLRDIPIGSWIKFGDGRVFQVITPTTARHVANPNVLDSWRVGNDVVDVCATRADEFQISPAKWGFRPGSLVRDPSGRVYLITTDGSDRGLPQKRWIETMALFQCYGWSLTNVREDTYGDLAVHATSANISTCSAPLRSFPNGSLVITGAGTVYVIEGGLKRHVLSPQVRDSWFAVTEPVAASDLELTAVSMGLSWGFRQGRLIQPEGEFPVYFVTDDMALRASGSRRHIVDPITLSERGYSFSNVVSHVAADLVYSHQEGTTLKNANDMP